VGRYTGPAAKISRNLGVNLTETPKIDAVMKRRPYASGQHGQTHKKISEFAQQLKEKQRLKMRFGIREKQLRRYYEIANRSKGNTGTILLQVLERRLDNVVFRAGLAETRRQARQMVAHGHFLLNGHRVTVPSILVKDGSVISVRPNSVDFIVRSSESAQAYVSPAVWLTVSKETASVRFDRLPEREELDPNTREQLVVEYYSR
jgi:small subunit ribosomal protein S4